MQSILLELFQSNAQQEVNVGKFVDEQLEIIENDLRYRDNTELKILSVFWPRVMRLLESEMIQRGLTETGKET